MDNSSFNKMFLGEFKYTGTDYREVRNGTDFHRIYSHQCPKCERMFFGYKHRISCFDCRAIADKLAGKS